MKETVCKACGGCKGITNTVDGYIESTGPCPLCEVSCTCKQNRENQTHDGEHVKESIKTLRDYPEEVRQAMKLLNDLIFNHGTIIGFTMKPELEAMETIRQDLLRACTCHPDERLEPCARKYALKDCTEDTP